ncbi:50S ribosomal protein L6 [Chlamydiales bacterium SCGC AG-110-M15]|nr:50S ribosomal protein L6 [Chlamydiales bacterium SCGC AG-110-M15]
MSRIGKEPVSIPKGVEVKVEGTTISVKGPKGTLTRELMDGILVSVDADKLTVSLRDDMKEHSNFHGLYRALINNMVVGVHTEFVKKLEMIGVGYRASVQGQLLDLLIGLSHPMKLPIPQGIKVAIEKNTNITITGADKQLVGQFAATIRSKRPPEPYKGKGIRYKDEYVRRKAGKSAKK